MNLYEVKIKGFPPKIYYAIAADPTTAYAIVRKYLDDKDIGMRQNRALDSLSVIAELGATHNALVIQEGAYH